MKRWAAITDEFRQAMSEKNYDAMHKLMNENFDLRLKTVQVSAGNIQMVELARSTGASAKFTGSGGAIIGLYRSESMFENLKSLMDRYEIEVIKPDIVINA